MSGILKFWRTSSRREKTYTNEPQVFTDYVRALSAALPLEPSQVEELWAALRSALRSELKKRGLWENSPSILGIYGVESWASDAGKSGPLEELVAECYSFIFVSRLTSLQVHSKIKPNIEGLIFLNIRHFLHERQKFYDPIGSHMFDVLRAAVQQAVEQGELRVLAGDERVRNDTVLGFKSEMVDLAQGQTELSRLVISWNDELLPDLVTLRGLRQEEIVQRLRQRLPDLLQHGITSFRFKDLVDPFKSDVRTRWAAILDLHLGERRKVEDDDDADEIVRVIEPEFELEDREFYRKTTECVLESIRYLEVDPKTRGYLVVLWRFLSIRVAAQGDETPPSLRKVAELLRIPRDRLPELYKILGNLLAKCRGSLMGNNSRLSGVDAKTPKVTVST